MDLDQKSYIVSGIVLLELLILIFAIILVIKDVISGYRNEDKSKYRIAAIKFSIAIVLIFIVSIIQFYVLLEQ